MSFESPPLPLELWGGVECTVNRVGDRYFNQLQRNGHQTRLEDLNQFAALGIQAIRYPVLWECIAPDDIHQADWSWPDERLLYLDDIGIRPIVGMVHHGSGPRRTSLTDPAFATGLAEFAHAVASRYPWVESYTPVNEPLTTARFSGLYGHWYPHKTDTLSFLKALLNQCRAVSLSMQAIRRVNPTAKLVQTEDLGKIFSTPLLSYQNNFENERRWLSFDLLCGRVNSDHQLWDYLLFVGLKEPDLTWFLDNPCPPDIFGINRYLTSDRFLDERLDRYPPHTHGGNGRQAYADVEAVRVCAEGICPPDLLLKEVWERYQSPIAVTEVHLGCTREEQLRWLHEIWTAAQSLKTQGIPIQAITAWSLLGAYDWNSLVTRDNGHYEPGVFDIRSPHPRATAIATFLHHLSANQPYNHPLLEIPGWWHRPDRLLYPPVSTSTEASTRSTEGRSIQPNSDEHTAESISRMPHPYPSTHPPIHPSTLPHPASPLTNSPSPLLITGATGTLGQAFARICEIRGIPYRLLTRREMDITNPTAIATVLDDLHPWAVINTAGYVRVDDAEREPHLCLRINADGAAILADACADRNIGLINYSSDLVFNGDRTHPYIESDTVAPLNVYGQSKVQAERWVLHHHPCSLVIRTSAFFGPWDEYNFLTIALRTLKNGHPFVAAEDAIISPTYVPDLVHASLDLLIDGECGIWHLSNPGAIAWDKLARLAAQQAGLDPTAIQACSMQELGFAAPRPTYSALSSERGVLLPELDRSISRYLQECTCI